MLLRLKKICHRLDVSLLRGALNFATLLFTSGRHSICSAIQEAPSINHLCLSHLHLPVSPLIRLRLRSFSVGGQSQPTSSIFPPTPTCTIWTDASNLRWGSLSNHEAWGMWSLVLSRLCDRTHFGGYYSICLLRWSSLSLPEMHIFPSSDVLFFITERQSLTPCRGLEQVGDNLPIPPPVLVCLWLQKLLEFACLGLFLAPVFCPPASGGQNIAHSGTACSRSACVCTESDILAHTHIFSSKQAFEAGFPNAAWPLLEDISAMNLGAIPSQNQHRPRYSSLSHTSNLNLCTVLAYRKRITPSPSCLHFTSSKRMTNSPFSQGLQFCTIHISSGSSLTGISHNTLHVRMFEQT